MAQFLAADRRPTAMARALSRETGKSHWSGWAAHGGAPAEGKPGIGCPNALIGIVMSRGTGVGGSWSVKKTTK